VHATFTILDKHDKTLRHVYEVGTASAPTQLYRLTAKNFTPTAEETEQSVRTDVSIWLRAEVRLLLDGAL